MVVGTPQYMSPEQAGGATVDGRSDQYSLACTLYEMLIGQPPFTGPSSQAVIARHSLEPVPSLRVVRQTVPPAVGGGDHAGHGEGARRPIRLDAAVPGQPARRRNAGDGARPPVVRASVARAGAVIALGAVAVLAAARRGGSRRDGGPSGPAR